MRIPIIICSATLLCAANAFGSKHYQLTSPSGVISSTINCDKELTYSVKYDNEEVISESPISITLTDGSVWGPMPVSQNPLAKRLTGHYRHHSLNRKQWLTVTMD